MPESASTTTTSGPEDGAFETVTKPSDPPKPASADPPPPAKPPRPLSPREQAEKTLVEAFPSIDVPVVKAVLSASGGNVEPAFDALLGMTDPDSQKDAPPPAKPPRPDQQSRIPTSTAQSQLEADEMYARQLHEHYSSTNRQQRQTQNPTDGQDSVQPRTQGEEQREHSFLDDDLPVIRENIWKGFIETQSTVNKWVTNFKKKLDGEDDEDFSSQPIRPAQGFQAGHQSHPNRGRKNSEMARRSSDRDRYDADPQVLGDDFSTLEIRDTEGKWSLIMTEWQNNQLIQLGAPPKKPQRPLANPDLFKSSQAVPGGRKAAFQNAPPEEADDLYPGSSDPSKQQSASGKSSKWQPLSAVDPSPVAENDPFSLGDSDDDKETKAKENESVLTRRPQTAAAEVIAEPVGHTPKNEPGIT